MFNAFKNMGSLIGKGFLIECFLEYYGDEMVAQIRKLLDDSGITAADMPDFIMNNRALPIPPQAFVKMKGLEDYFETLEPARIFEWLAKARPDLANELVKLDELGAEYIVRFKYFMIDSIRASEAAPPEEAKEATPLEEAKEETETETAPTSPMEKLCESCGASFTVTEEESEITECPNCR